MGRDDDSTGGWVRATEGVRPLVLVAEDDWDAMQLYEEMLVLRGFRVVACSDGADALEKARTRMPAAIVLDLALPLLSGWHVAEALRGSEATAKIPIIAVTAHSDAAAIARARAAGCDRVFVKPLDHRALVRALLSVTSRARRADPPREP
jgi:two-component system cell cycle response regulator DivK